MEHHHRVETSVNEISRHLAELTGFPGTPTYAAARPDEVYRIALNPSHAKRWLRWAPQASLVDGLRRTVEWFRG